MGAAAAIIIRKERDIVDLYRGAGATSSATARDPEELGINTHVAFNLLVRHAVLRDAGGGRYYLDEPTWNTVGLFRRRVAIDMIVAMLVVLAALIVTGIVAFNRTR